MTHALSSNVKVFWYDFDTEELWVGYRNTTGYYVYEQVPALVYRAMSVAEPQGSSLHGHVLGRYRERRESGESP